jgi:hypothetical protein
MKESEKVTGPRDLSYGELVACQDVWLKQVQEKGIVFECYDAAMESLMAFEQDFANGDDDPQIRY